jgi:hypothetical protein
LQIQHLKFLPIRFCYAEVLLVDGAISEAELLFAAIRDFKFAIAHIFPLGCKDVERLANATA